MVRQAGTSQVTASESLLSAYERDGYCIQENVLSAEECAELIEAGRNLKDFKNGITKPNMMPHRENPIFLKAMKNPAIVAQLELELGGKIHGLQTEFFYCKPGTRGFSMHQDNFFVQAPYGVFGSAWLALTDTYAEKGGLIVYPGTHKCGLLPVQKIQLARDEGQDPNANNEETIIPPSYQPLNARVPAGAALHIHGHVVHGSNPNSTNEWRYVLLMTYIKQGETFRPGNYAQREPVDVYS